MKRILLFSWYLIGVLLSLPALIFIILSNWIGIKAQKRFLRSLTKEDLGHDKD